MNPIQVLLVLALVALVVLYFRLFRYQSIVAVLFGGVFLAGIFAVLFPESTNRLANAMGVGRGADLLLYGFVILFYLSIAVFYGKLRRLEEQQTIILRELTLLKDAQPTE